MTTWLAIAGCHWQLAASALTVWLMFTGYALGQGSFARVGDVTHVQGQGTNTIIGMGLIFGLSKSGDGDKFAQTQRALAQALSALGSPVESLEDLKEAKNVAIVQIQVTIPEHGAREGELLDVRVSALAAKSLEGGTLLVTPLIYDDPEVRVIFAKAQGAIELPDPDKPNVGVIRGGARMEQDVFNAFVATGFELQRTGLTNSWIQPDHRYVTLVLDDAHAGWSMAAAVAQAVDAGLKQLAQVERIALAVDSKSIVVMLPVHQYEDPVSFVRDVQQTPIFMESNEARVTINKAASTIVVTGNVRISPTVVSQAGLTVNVVNPPPGGPPPQPPPFEQQIFVPLDNAQKRDASMTDLLEALNRLKVPFKDRVAIFETMKRSGTLHAKIIYEQ